MRREPLKICSWQLGTAYGPFTIADAKDWCSAELGRNYSTRIAKAKSRKDFDRLGADTGLFSASFWSRRCLPYKGA